MRNTILTIIAALTITVISTTYNRRTTTMPEIKFDIGQNIHETAKRSGAPRFATRNVAGLVSYDLTDLPLDIPAHYVRPGFEITVSPLFGLTLYADDDHNNGLAVQSAQLQFANSTAKSHDSAQIFVENLIGQFERGKWKRHIREFCPAVTGRSSFLNETGEVGRIYGCPLDPQHRLSKADWIELMGSTQYYEWIGEGVLATLTVAFSDDARGITYNMDLDFEDFAIKKRRDQANLDRILADGDKSGRNSTVKERANDAAFRARVEILEHIAATRGDKIIPR